MSGEKGYTNQALELNENGKSPCSNSDHTGVYTNEVNIGTGIV